MKEERRNFNKDLEKQLHKLSISNCIKECNDAHCQDINHFTGCDGFLSNIVEIIDMCAKNSLPIPGGKVRIKNYPPACWQQDDALFWHSVWISAGRPLNTKLHRIMKTKNIYQYQIRKCKRMSSTLKKKLFCMFK